MDDIDSVSILSTVDVLELIQEVQAGMTVRCNTTVTMPAEVAGEFESIAKELGTTRHKLMVLILTIGVKNLRNSLNLYRSFVANGTIKNTAED